jgi:hypothetical protein
LPVSYDDDELKDIESKDGCCIISDEHFGHLFSLASSISSGILKPLANLLIFDDRIFFLFLSIVSLKLVFL